MVQAFGSKGDAGGMGIMAFKAADARKGPAAEAGAGRRRAPTADMQMQRAGSLPDCQACSTAAPCAACGGHGSGYFSSRIRTFGPNGDDGRLAVQARLDVSQPGDTHELEAERVAATVTADSGPEVTNFGGASATDEPRRQTTVAQRVTGARPEDDAQPAAGDAVERDIVARKGAGQPLSASERGFMEPRFDRDFSGVRLHTDEGANRLARQLGAEAFTTGQDIFFREGQYRPASVSGRALLAHELTHTVQQDNSTRPAPDTMRSQASSEAIRRQRVQRDTTGPDAKSAHELIDDNTTAYLFLDEAGLARDLIRLIPERSATVEEVLNSVAGHNQDDVAIEIVNAMSGRLGEIPESLRMLMVSKLVGGVVLDDEEGAIAAIWISFDRDHTFDPLASVAARNRDLWKKSLWESDQLDDYVGPVVTSFHWDVEDLADTYLRGNNEALISDAARYGIDLENPVSLLPTLPGYLDSIRAIVPGIVTLKNRIDELRTMHVGYHQISDCLIGECKSPARFNPDYQPQYPPDGTESPPWPTWEATKLQFDRVSAVISAFSNMYPTIYLLIQQDKLNALNDASDASRAVEIVRDTMQKTHGKISESRDRIFSGKITVYDLQLIQTQLFSGAAKQNYEPRYSWEEPFYQDVANDELKGHAAREFWYDLGLSLVAAAALIAAPFTGGATAAFLVGFGVGIGAAQAGLSWEKYLSLSAASDATVNNELRLVAEGQVSAQLVDAIIQTVGVFLDAYGAKAATAAVKTEREAVELAEQTLQKQLSEELSNRMLRGAGKDAALTAGLAGVSIGIHELADEEPAPDFTGSAQAVQLPLDPDADDTTTTSVSRIVIFRVPGGGGGGSAPTAALNPLYLTGGEFEEAVTKALLRGELKGLPQMHFVIPGQYTGSGWGIDRIGIVVNETSGAVEVFHLEMKYVSFGSTHIPELGTPSAGTQTGEAWTRRAVDGFLESDHDVARAGRERLRRALRKLHPGETIDIERMRTFLHAKLPHAKIRIIVPPWAELKTLYKQVAALVRWGRSAKILKHFPV